MSDDFFVEPVVVKAQPFIKWAGGKRQLIPEIVKFIPEKFHSYFEPFIGGGAVFFHLANEGRFQFAKINDYNREITDLYTTIQAQPQALMDALDAMAALGFTRDVYNEIRATKYDRVEEWAQRSARTIYLNKCGFNGLYRQNKKGLFNVPWGKKEHVTLYDRENILACHEALQNTAIETGDFRHAIHRVGPGSVVYLDPPYVPHSDTSNFTSYTSDGFTLEDQKRVVDVFRRAADAGATVIASNNDTPLVRELYDGFEVHSVQARRNINSKGGKRGSVGEVLVVHKP